MNAVGSQLPSDFRILVRTAAAPWLFERTVRVPFTLLPGECDTGVVQIDSLRLDEDATVAHASEFYTTFESRVADETALLDREEVRLVISDAPPLACEAAKGSGVPCIVLSNFTWDWIYEHYAERFEGARHVLALIREAYAEAAEGWRLPLGGGFGSFATVRDLPFVARHATRSREDVLRLLGVDGGRPLALASFGGYGLDDFDWARLDCRDHWTVVTTGREGTGTLPAGIAYVDEARMYDAGLRYEDLVGAVDVVVTKPGYGIVSECVANDTAMLYTSRGHFPEYDVMVRKMPRLLRSAYLDQEALLAGRWLEPLNALRAAPPPPERPRTDGAEVASALIAGYLER